MGFLSNKIPRDGVKPGDHIYSWRLNNEYFKTHLKYEKNPKIREAITHKFNEYLRRAEELRAVLDEGGSGRGSNGGGDDAAVATKPKSKPGGDGEDTEQSKLRAGLNSAIVREKPNIKYSKA